MFMRTVDPFLTNAIAPRVGWQLRRPRHLRMPNVGALFQPKNASGLNAVRRAAGSIARQPSTTGVIL
jgi:hypothetical protein